MIKELYVGAFIIIFLADMVGKLHLIWLGECDIRNSPLLRACDLVVNLLLLIGFIVLFL